METKQTLSSSLVPAPKLGAESSSQLIQARSELDAAVEENLPFFLSHHPEYVSLKSLDSYWNLPGSKLSNHYGNGGLVKPFKDPLAGKGKALPILSVLEFLYSKFGGIHSLPTIRVSRGLIEVSEGIHLPRSGCGSSSKAPIYGVLSDTSEKILISGDTVFAGEDAYVALMVRVDHLADLIPGHTALPADPIYGLRVLFESVGSDAGSDSSLRDSQLLDAL